MSAGATTKNLLKGGEFLVKETDFNDVFTPQDVSEEQQAIRQAAVDFLDAEVLKHPHLANEVDLELTKTLLEKIGELGLLGLAIPEEYGGMGQDYNTNSIVVEAMAKARSFTLSWGAHVGIGSLPIVYFGNEEQKQKYLPKLASGELKACYCLTEPGSGSDALGAKTRADLNAEGTHYILNGQKMWITNSGFADVFIVFAQIDGDKFTGFIVEKDMPGLSLGAEEKKMGIKGSSTRLVFLENVKVPKENLLGEINDGFKYLMTELSQERLVVGLGAIAAAEGVLAATIQYTKDRMAFGKPISELQNTRFKLAEMETEVSIGRIFADRCVELHLDKKLDQASASACKYWLTDLQAKVADECLQLHGGYGYMWEYLAGRAFADARVQRIYAGTNEIMKELIARKVLK